MTRPHDAIKLAIDNYLKAADLTDLVIGTVISSSPLRVRIKNNFVVDGKDIKLNTNVTSMMVPVMCQCPLCGEVPGFVMNGIVLGDKLVMMKVEQGQTFVVIGKVVG